MKPGELEEIIEAAQAYGYCAAIRDFADAEVDRHDARRLKSGTGNYTRLHKQADEAYEVALASQIAAHADLRAALWRYPAATEQEATP